MGVDNIEPNTPPFVMVNVPPCISSTVRTPSRALMARRLISPSISAIDMTSAFLTTGTIKPLGELTAMHTST